MNAAPAGFEGEPAIGFDISPSPSFGSGFHPLKLRVPVFTAKLPGFWKQILIFLIFQSFSD
jgi:hypothetical protein